MRFCGTISKFCPILPCSKVFARRKTRNEVHFAGPLISKKVVLVVFRLFVDALGDSILAARQGFVFSSGSEYGLQF